MTKAPDAFRTISEVADELDLPQHVLRFWESRFPQIRPMKRGGGRRYYRPEDVELLRGIRHLLYSDGYTIRGVQRILREQGIRTVQSVGQGGDVVLPARTPEDAADAATPHETGARGMLDFLPPMFSGAASAAAQQDANARSHDIDADDIDADDVDVDVADDDEVPELVMPRRGSGTSELAEAGPPVAAGGPPAPFRSSPPQLPPARLSPADLNRLETALLTLESCKRLLEEALEDER